MRDLFQKDTDSTNMIIFAGAAILVLFILLLVFMVIYHLIHWITGDWEFWMGLTVFLSVILVQVSGVMIRKIFFGLYEYIKKRRL